MPQPMTLLELSPDSKLHFCKNSSAAPNNVGPSRTLKLTNTTNGYVAFKVKTTAPKSYLVRPSSGTMSPNGTVEVQIILQAQGAEGQPSNHRFLVQAVATPNEKPMEKEKWAELANAAKSGTDSVQEQRLSVEVEESMEAAPVGNQPAMKSFEPSIQQAPERSIQSNVGQLATADTPASELKVKYDEIVQYTLMLEKEKKRKEQELQNAKQKQGKGASADGGGYTAMHLLAVAVLVFALSYGSKFVI